MNDEGALHRRPRQINSSGSYGSSGRGVTWADVDRVLEVRSRLVVALDAIEEGNVRMAELCLFQLLDDLDGAETILGHAA